MTDGHASGTDHASVQASSNGQVGHEVLRSMHAELDLLDGVHVDDRVEVFERLNRTLAHELAALDEV